METPIQWEDILTVTVSLNLHDWPTSCGWKVSGYFDPVSKVYLHRYMYLCKCQLPPGSAAKQITFSEIHWMAGDVDIANICTDTISTTHCD